MHSETEETDSGTSEDYAYTWKPGNGLSLKQFLQQYKPSKVKDDDEKYWIRVEKKEFPEEIYDSDVVDAAETLLQTATEAIVLIQRNPEIPWRPDHVAGVRGKKELQHELRTETIDGLKQLSQESGMTSGKVLFFVHKKVVDHAWAKVACALIKGPLKTSIAYAAKVSTVRTEHEDPMHVICLYLPDVYDKGAIIDTMRLLVDKVGMAPTTVKSDLYTELGIYSHHPSGIKPRIWHVKELLPGENLRNLVGGFAAVNGSMSKKRRPRVKAIEQPVGLDWEHEVGDGEEGGLSWDADHPATYGGTRAPRLGWRTAERSEDEGIRDNWDDSDNEEEVQV